jgi:transposase
VITSPVAIALMVAMPWRRSNSPQAQRRRRTSATTNDAATAGTTGAMSRCRQNESCVAATTNGYSVRSATAARTARVSRRSRRTTLLHYPRSTDLSRARAEPPLSFVVIPKLSPPRRNGTTSLYAALEIATGEVTGACYPQHRHQEFLAFLNQIVRAYPRRPLHVVLDNSSTHSTPEVERWLQRHKRVHFHFTPTSASWMNMVEIWFSILTKQQVRRGVYHDVPELIAAIEMFIEGYNERARPFVWTKTADAVSAKATKQQATSGTLH